MDWINKHKGLVGYTLIFIGGGVSALSAPLSLDVLKDIGANLGTFGLGLVIAGRTESDAQAKDK